MKFISRASIILSMVFTLTLMSFTGVVDAADVERVVPGPALAPAEPVMQMNALMVGSEPGLTVTDMTYGGVSVTGLVYSIVGPGVQVRNITYTGAPGAAATFSGGQNSIGISDGVILSTGLAKDVTGSNGRDQDNRSSSNGKAGDSNLAALINASGLTRDAAVLEFEFLPENNQIDLQYVFSSEEYNDFYKNINDVMGIFIGPVNASGIWNPMNIAWIPGTSSVPVSVFNVNRDVNSIYFKNNAGASVADATYNTAMDGFTQVFHAKATVNSSPGQWYKIKIAIADYNDGFVDSNVFIKAGSLMSKKLTLNLTPALSEPHVDLTGASVTLFNEGDASTLTGTADAAGKVVFEAVPNGHWKAYISDQTVSHSKVIHTAPLAMIIGSSPEYSFNLPVLPLNRNGDSTFDIADAVWFAGHLNEQHWDFNGDGASDRQDLLKLLQRINP